jgi:hypothetical protein
MTDCFSSTLHAILSTLGRSNVLVNRSRRRNERLSAEVTGSVVK